MQEMHIIDGLLMTSLTVYPRNLVYSTPNFSDLFTLVLSFSPLDDSNALGS